MIEDFFVNDLKRLKRLQATLKFEIDYKEKKLEEMQIKKKELIP